MNVSLDVYFVRDLGFGLAGAAYATLLAQGLSAVLAFGVFIRRLSKIKTEKTKIFDKKELGRISYLAIPSIIQQSTITIGQLLVQSVVNSFGVGMLAGFSAAIRVESLIIVPITSLGNAISSYTSQNVGAKKLERLEKGLRASIAMVGIYSVVILICLKFNSANIIAYFMNESSSNLAKDTGVAYLDFIGYFFLLVGSKHCVDGILRGVGDVKIFTLANIVNLTIRVSLSMALAHKVGIAMVWYAVPLGWLANLVISTSYYLKIKKQNYSLDSNG